MLFHFAEFSFLFSIFINYFRVVPFQMENKKRYSDENGLRLLFTEHSFSMLPAEASYEHGFGQQQSKKRLFQQKKGRQKGRKSQKERRPLPTIASQRLPPALINAFVSAPSPIRPPIAAASAVLFDRGGGGQWDLPEVKDHRQHNQLEQMAKLAKDGDGTLAERSEEHSVVHLISRPTQLYYFGGGDGSTDAKSGLGSVDDGLAAAASVQVSVGQVCRVKVPTADVFYISYEDDERSGGGIRPFVDVFFHCSQYWAWCCGVDCCQLDPALMFTGACVLVVLCALFVHCCLRSEFGQRVCVRRLFRVHQRRHKRIIARTNAQRRKSAVGDGITTIGHGDGGIVRKPSATVSSGDAEQLRHNEEQQKQQQQTHRRSGSDLRRIIRNSIRETFGRGHRRLVRTGHQLRGDRTKNVRSVPEIMVTEPSSSLYASEEEQEEEMEQYKE